MGEGEYSDALEDFGIRPCNEHVDQFSLSRRTGEGRGEGFEIS